MSTYRQLSKALAEAQADADAKSEPHSVVEWWNPSRHYLVRTLVKAQHLTAKHPEAKIVETVWPTDGTLEGAS